MTDSVEVLRRLAYKAVMNYVSNTLKLNKEYIFDYVDQRLEKFTKDWIEQRSYSNKLDRMISDEVASVLQKGFTNQWYTKETLEGLIKRIVQEEVRKRVDEVIEVNINFKGKKDDQT